MKMIAKTTVKSTAKTTAKSTSSRIVALAGLVAGALLFAGCTADQVQIGAVLPLTGVDATYGTSIKKGVELAYEELQANAEEPTNIMLLSIADSESDPTKAQERLKELYDQGAMAVIGGVTTDEAKAMLEVVDNYTNERVLLSPSASTPDLTGLSRNFYRIWPSDYTAATKMVDFARGKEIKTVVVIVERTYGKGIQGVFQTAFEEQGGQVLEVLEIPEGTDLGGIVERVMTLSPDAVYLAAYAPATSSLITALRDQDYSGDILTTSAFATPSAIAQVGKAAHGVFLTKIFFELDSDYAHVQKFVSAYHDKYGESPDLYAAHGYDAMMILAAAAAGRPALPGEIHKGLRDNIKEYPGVTGAIQFNDKGDVQKFPRIYIIGEDLGLYDYNKRIEEEQEKLRQRQEELRKRLEDLQRKANRVGG